MLLESRLNDRHTLVVDCESVGGIDKGALSVVSHPDKLVPTAVETIRALADSLGAALGTGVNAPSEMEVTFAIRVDSNAVVQVARANEQGQFKVTLRWSS